MIALIKGYRNEHFASELRCGQNETASVTHNQHSRGTIGGKCLEQKMWVRQSVELNAKWKSETSHHACNASLITNKAVYRGTATAS